MASLLEKGSALLREAAARLTVRRETAPIDTVEALFSFVSQRAAFVAQHKLYGYLKTRMGTRYPSMFEDDVFVQSINIAKMQVYAACLADLTIHAVSRPELAGGLETAEREAIARACHRQGVAANAAEMAEAHTPEDWIERFEARIAGIHWENAGATGEVFEESPKALVKWAPIAPELKKYDAEIVRNSVRYAWNEIRRDLRQRLDGASVARDWKRGGDPSA
jgi:hypothetical protein